MHIVHISSKEKLAIRVTEVAEDDYARITKKRFSFDWKQEKENDVYKLTIDGQNDILGLISLLMVDEEERIEIKLLAVSSENIGANKTYENIAGSLIAFAARLAIKGYGVNAAISLIPKTKLAKHYINKYGFETAGKSLFMEGQNLLKLLHEYDG